MIIVMGSTSVIWGICHGFETRTCRGRWRQDVDLLSETQYTRGLEICSSNLQAKQFEHVGGKTSFCAFMS